MGLLDFLIRKRLNELDAKAEDARDRAQDAVREAEVSARRREIVEKHVVQPLLNAGSHNQFAELIRQSLIIGNHNQNHQRGENA